MFPVATVESFLNRPFELSVRKKGGWPCIFALSICIPLFVYIQQPYGIGHWHQSHKELYVAGFGFVFLLAYSIIYAVLPHYCEQWYAPENWTMRRELLTTLLFFVLLGFANWLYEGLLIEKTELTFYSMLKVQFFTFSYGLMPKVAKVMLLRWQYLFPVNDIITPTPVENNCLQTVENDFPIHTIQYIKADKNNIHQHHYQDGEHYTDISRCTMNQAEINMQTLPHFVRCHNSFIVNMQHVDHHKSRIRTNKLCIKNSNVEIPVSKKFKDVINKRLAPIPANR